METVYQTLDPSLLSQVLVKRGRSAHKGDFGHVLVIGGDFGMGGAVRLAAEAALRVGAGLVSVATRAEHVSAMNAACSEVMCHAVETLDALEPLLQKASVIILGPGLGQSDWSQHVFKAALAVKKPTIVDADALNLLSQEPFAYHDWILTPHPGEAARLLKCSSDDIQDDRGTAAKKLLEKYDGVIVLKGANTIVQAAHETPSVCKAGNPGMATAGMGDVLSGVLGGLLAQHFSLLDAARVGVLVHAMAGDLAAQKGGERGLIATDLMPYLRALVNTDSE